MRRSHIGRTIDGSGRHGGTDRDGEGRGAAAGPAPRHRRLLGRAAVGLLFLPWIGAGALWLLFDLTGTQWAFVITGAAIATEFGLYAGAALFGLTAFDRARNWLHLRRGRAPHTRGAAS